MLKEQQVAWNKQLHVVSIILYMYIGGNSQQVIQL